MDNGGQTGQHGTRSENRKKRSDDQIGKVPYQGRSSFLPLPEERGARSLSPEPRDESVSVPIRVIRGPTLARLSSIIAASQG